MAGDSPLYYWDTCLFLAGLNDDERKSGEMDGVREIIQRSETPAHGAMDGRDGAVRHGLPQRLALAIVENAGGARRLAVHKTVRTLGVEADNPIAHDLQPGAADPRRVRARAAGLNLRKRHPSTGSGDAGLTGIARLPRKPAQSSGIKTGAKRKRSGHGKPSQKLFAILNQTGADSGIARVSQAFKDLV